MMTIAMIWRGKGDHVQDLVKYMGAIGKLKTSRAGEPGPRTIRQDLWLLGSRSLARTPFQSFYAPNFVNFRVAIAYCGC